MGIVGRTKQKNKLHRSYEGEKNYTTEEELNPNPSPHSENLHANVDKVCSNNRTSNPYPFPRENNHRPSPQPCILERHPRRWTSNTGRQARTVCNHLELRGSSPGHYSIPGDGTDRHPQPQHHYPRLQRSDQRCPWRPLGGNKYGIGWFRDHRPRQRTLPGGRAWSRCQRCSVGRWGKHCSERPRLGCIRRASSSTDCGPDHSRRRSPLRWSGSQRSHLFGA